MTVNEMDNTTAEDYNEAVEYTEDYDQEETPSQTAKSLEEEISALQAKVSAHGEQSTAGTSQETNDGAAGTADLGYDPAAQAECDSRSIYVGNVDYAVESALLAEVFKTCGTVNKVTIPGDYQNHPKGYAYIEFAEPEAVEHAIKLAGTAINGRAINVAPKRTNIGGYNKLQGRGRGRSTRGRGRVPYGMQPMMVPIPVPSYFDPSYVSRGGRSRGRGRARRGGYAPY